MTTTGPADDTSMTSTLLENLEVELRQVLTHLYDPGYAVPSTVAAALRVDEGTPLQAVREALITSLQSLEPSRDVPKHARAWRIHQVMVMRYLEQKTQEEVAQQLAITVRHLSRHQAEGLTLLARKLCDGRSPCTGLSSSVSSGSLQVDRELAALEEHAPGAIADVGRALRGVIQLIGVLAQQKGVTLVLADEPVGVFADIHPSVLHQILVATINCAVRCAGASGDSAEVRIGCRVVAGAVEVQLTGAPWRTPEPREEWVVYRLLAAQGPAFSFTADESAHTATIRLPLSRHVVVLVIDDNEDMTHFYNLCAVNTRYRIVSIGEGNQAFTAIADTQPSLIVLDLMLPDIDGWELLAQLHEHPLSRALPIIVCSVVREEELALALGATLCVSKPVRRQQFREALDRALGPA